MLRLDRIISNEIGRPTFIDKFNYGRIFEGCDGTMASGRMEEDFAISDADNQTVSGIEKRHFGMRRQSDERSQEDYGHGRR